MKKINLIVVLLAVVLIAGTFALAEAPEAAEPMDLSFCMFAELESTAEICGAYYKTEDPASFPPITYANESMLLGGDEYINTVMVVDEGFTVYGTAVGMPIDEAEQLIYENAPDMELMGYDEESGSVIFVRRTSEDSLIDYDGYDSFLTLNALDGQVLYINWLSFEYLL